MAPRKPHAETSTLEWASAAVGAVLLATVFVVTLHDALGGRNTEPPAITVEARRVTPSGARYLVEYDAINKGGSTAAAVEIEAELTSPGAPPETATSTLDYVAADAKASGGLYFDGDPRKGTLSLRAKGYQEP